MVRPSGDPQPEFGAVVRELRSRRGASQKQLAREAGISPPTLCGIERGYGNPTWTTVVALAKALQVSVAEIATRAEEQARGEFIENKR